MQRQVKSSHNIININITTLSKILDTDPPLIQRQKTHTYIRMMSYRRKTICWNEK